MRILFVHNKYGITSGEEIMLRRIIGVLERNGHQVETYFQESSKIESILDKMLAFFSGIWSFSARKEIYKEISEFKPDIVQIQNLYPLISPSILPLIRKKGIPIVMRLSNYRLICPSGLLLSHGELCNRCLGGKEYWCILRNCEESFLKSFGYALRNWSARVFQLYKENVTRYYAQTVFQKNKLVAEGFNPDRIDVIPNMVEVIDDDIDWKAGEYVGFVGRMSPEKGIDTFLQAARQCPNIPFKVAGDSGNYRCDEEIPDNVELLGHINRELLKKFYSKCLFVVVPSLWYEGFPGVIIEAMRYGKPVIASRIGGLSEIVKDQETGLLFRPGDVDELARLVNKLWYEPNTVYKYGVAGRKKVMQEYAPMLYYEKLMQVYDKVLSEFNTQSAR